MDNMADKLIAKLISGKRLTDDEFEQLELLFNDTNYRKQLNSFFENHWQQSIPEDVALDFKQLQNEIRKSYSRFNLNQLILVLSKVAAVLFIPLLAAALYFYITKQVSSEMLTLYTQNSEFTNVMLPDSSKVWLNVNSELSYPADFGINSRKLELSGEAYFEVKKNEKLPFEVVSGNITTTALGTHFLVSAYPGSDVIKSSLIEGSTRVSFSETQKTQILSPGQQLVYNKDRSKISIQTFNENYELSWKNKELSFMLTPFDEVVSVLENWYDINITFDSSKFKSETLTVHFEKNETLENVLNVLSKTNGFYYSVEDKEIKLTKIDVMKEN